MTPEQKFARWVKYSCMTFAILFIYFLFADMIVPVTTESMATRIVTKVAPRISGQITHVAIHNDQIVHKGSVLFSIDPASYLLAVKQAQLNLSKAVQEYRQLNASIAASKAKLEAQSVVTQQKQREADRIRKVFLRHGVSTQQRDNAVSNAIASQANLSAAKATLLELKVRQGSSEQENLKIQIAKNQLQQAKLNLSYTQVKAEHDGIITNLQLKNGAFVKTGQSVIALVDTNLDIIADFREKSLHAFPIHSSTYVTFDGNPSKIYKGVISSIDAGVSSGQFSANGSLATPVSSNRWVRDAQRLRIHITLNNTDAFANNLASGALASVQLIPTTSILTSVAWLQVKTLSLLHYIY